jgi:hypothetical protein
MNLLEKTGTRAIGYKKAQSIKNLSKKEAK